MNALIMGATGMVGSEVLKYCLDAAQITNVLVLGRRSTRKTHPKLKEIEHENFLFKNFHWQPPPNTKFFTEGHFESFGFKTLQGIGTPPKPVQPLALPIVGRVNCFESVRKRCR
jgi:hypothetical protein